MRTEPAQEPLFRAWLEEYRGILAKVGRSYADSPAEAQDLRQEMMLQLWISLASFKGQARPSTWIYRVCLNTAMTWLRGDSRRKRRIEPLGDLGDVAATTASPAEAAASRDMLEALYAAIRALPQFDRALVLLMLDGVAYREMAEVTGMTENHVGVALTRARRRLAVIMKGATDELE